ncbi:MAG: alpha-1,2-fucosyltransferase [Bacteroidetes bacterium]|nr:alpha-1,2-fucosyltransferase [Bacteroidota bacterium]
MSIVISKIVGGLGNQMFQYATSRALALKNESDLLLDISEFQTYTLRPYELGCFSLHVNIADPSALRRIVYPAGTLRTAYRWLKSTAKTGKPPIRKYSEPHFHFDPNVFLQHGNVYLDGYWQSERYFKDIEHVIRNDFRFKHQPDSVNLDLIQKMGNECSVSLHIRRGDYVADERSNAVHGTMGIEYYKNAVQYIVEREANPQFYMFSDDRQWIEQNFKIPFPITFICHNTGSKSYEDIRLMSMCKHNIIANSSFSWWGAWLNNNASKIVIAPKKWFNDPTKDTKDLFPESWIKL